MTTITREKRAKTRTSVSHREGGLNAAGGRRKHSSSKKNAKVVTEIKKKKILGKR